MADWNTCYVSCGCNRAPNCADWGQNGFICYGASRAVVISTPQGPSRVEQTLAGHKSKVSCVKWIKHPQLGSETEFVSCSADKTIIVWRKGKQKAEVVGVLEGHTSTVTVVSAIYVVGKAEEIGEKTHTLIASASVDSTVKIWERKEEQDEFSCIQTIAFGTGFALDVSWVILPGTKQPLLAIGGDDQKIYLLTQKENQFVTKQKLVGHEDWVRGLDFTVTDSGDVLLASCGQDYFIRIWRISRHDPTGLSEPSGVTDSEQDLKLKENTFTLTTSGNDSTYAVSLESVLQGHENWIYSIRWKPPIFKDGQVTQPMCLLSASMDKTMILWEPDPDTGMWIEKVRVGEVGGNTLGFYGGIFGPSGRSMMAHGYQGAFHVWHQQAESSTWVPGVTVGGHFDSVEDIAWEPKEGLYLLSASLDQTTRVHGYWNAKNISESSWHEIARPQVHGYDMQCIAPINSYSFASGADEKVLRVFEAPRNFIENLGTICQVNVEKALDNASAPQGASVPALGLSNKAVFEDVSQNPYQGHDEALVKSNDQYMEAYFSPLSLKEPPTEDNLIQNTLWPEVQKLYGHGNEIFAVATHPDGSVLASACKAAKAEHAEIILWDTETWRKICHLQHHQLTVTQLKFSHQGEYLLSVSRDRTWGLYRHRLPSQPQSDALYSGVAFSDKKSGLHSRIIWACDWSHDDKYFVTVSRDKKAVIWSQVRNETADSGCYGNYGACSEALSLPDSITAVAFAPIQLPDNRYIMAFGLDNGDIYLYTWTDQDKTTQAWTQQACLSEAHQLTVKKVAFRPVVGDPQLSEGADDRLLLASCAADHSVRIVSINLQTLQS